MFVVKAVEDVFNLFLCKLMCCFKAYAGEHFICMVVMVMIMVVTTASAMLIVFFMVVMMLVVMASAFAVFIVVMVMMVSVTFLVLMVVVVMLVVVASAFAMLIVVVVMMFMVMFMLVVVMVVTAAAMFVVFFMMVLVFFLKLMEVFFHGLAFFHSLNHLFARELVPVGCNDNGFGVLFTKKLYRLVNLFLCHACCSAEENGRCIFNLVVKKFTKVFHIHFALCCIHHCGV